LLRAVLLYATLKNGMIEEQYITKLKSLWPTGEKTESSLEAIALADKAVQAHPLSAALWCIRGDLIQLGPANCPHELQEALKSYQHAIKSDPTYAEAYESINYFLDAVENKPAEAGYHFKEAAKHQ